MTTTPTPTSETTQPQQPVLTVGQLIRALATKPEHAEVYISETDEGGLGLFIDESGIWGDAAAEMLDQIVLPE